MTNAHALADPASDRIGGSALIAYGIVWLAVAGSIAVVVRLQTPTPAELLRDVADRPALWIGANAALIAQQALLTVATPALVSLLRIGRPASDALRGLAILAGGALVASGVLHGVFGAHLATKITDGQIDPSVVLEAELVHALGDTCWFVGVAALAAVTAIGAWSQRRVPGRGRWLGATGALAVACNLLQFGWFADHVFGVFAGPGTLLQAAWLAGTGLAASRDPSPWS